MMNLSTDARYLDNRMQHHFWFRVIASCLLLTGASSALDAQGCSDFWTCDCGTTINPGYCGTCWYGAEGAGLACALGGQCPGGSPQNTCSVVFAQCMTNITPTPPAPPTPVSQPLQCGPQAEVVPAPKLAPQLRFSPTSMRPAAASSPCTITFLDPVALNAGDADLMNGNAITTSTARLASYGRSVSGIAADNAARVVLRIGANEDGETLTITLSDDLTSVPGYSSWGNLGGLYDINDTNPDNAKAQQTLDVKATTGPDGAAMAFAVYRAPPDYVRTASNGSVVNKDFVDPNNPGAADITPRYVSFQVTSKTYPNAVMPVGYLNVWRPPVVMVHGLWDDDSLFKHFFDFDARYRRFEGVLASWAQGLAGKISSSNTDTNLIGFGQNDLDQSFRQSVLRNANSNQLGIACNAPRVSKKLVDAVRDIRRSNGIAAAQADVVAHSMGGLMIRKVENLPGFQGPDSFGVGRIHKLITAGTPYLGSPFASAVFNIPILGDVLGWNGRLAFGQSVTLTDSTVCGGPTLTTGAIYDLQGDSQGIGGGLTDGLKNLMTSSGHAVPTHVMAGKMDATNFVFAPQFAAPGTALTTYNAIFGGHNSDGIVSVTSQLAVPVEPAVPNDPPGGDVTPGLFHSSVLIGLKIPLPSPSFPFPPLAKVIFQGLAEFSPQSQIVTSVLNLLQWPQAFYQTFGSNPFVELKPPIQ